MTIEMPIHQRVIAHFCWLAALSAYARRTVWIPVVDHTGKAFYSAQERSGAQP